MISSKVIISLDNLIIHFISEMIEMEEILENNIEDLEIKVSSVLNRQISEYGKNFMFDGREDTCWNSDQGTPQWVRIIFDSTKYITKLQLMFQGGFVGNNCWLETSTDEENEKFEKLQDIYPEDTNKLQNFDISTDGVPCKGIKVHFADSTDFFGRITIYQMKLFVKS